MNLRPLTWLIPLTAFAAVAILLLINTNTSAKSEDQREDAPAAPVAQAAAAFSEEDRRSYAPLSFDEMFVTPAGPKGLEYTTKIKAMDGKKICITGFMVRHADIDTSAFLFCAIPRVYNEREEGLADSIPPHMVYVIQPVRGQEAPAWRREKMTLYGTLELGSHQELSGRISHLRLRCEAITDAHTSALLEVRKPVAFQLGRAVPLPGDVGALPRSDVPAPFFNPRRNRDNNITSDIP
ncbi:hypothetical protein [Prosthecobacter sp.]|uniref:hypothetical protein n=1 Tax=Prosthecobacter sp. TaxID=1965333 RepID=UPI003784E853